ncbi:MAG TPA: 3-methyl-2-oxobutanoate hydroxymethyltransferase [Vicinamibacteria bacterium]|nr:3-methyl-2-oxobutanoate hydroxymethyltransferase [Vicinamibacteria bacterium]
MTDRKKVTLPALRRKMAAGTPLTMITCYDYSMAHLVEEAGVDMVLVGDSLGMTMLGYPSTLPVTMEDMIRHGAAVHRGSPTSWLVIDMPYMSYQPSNEKAIESAGRLIAETGADAVKLEGGREMADRIQSIERAGIPVMAHLGLTPQSASALGGFRLQGKTADAAIRIVEDASIVEQAGAFSILMELVPDRICRMVTERASVPIIGLGSGPHAHGQLLIFHDVLGLYPDFAPRMAKVYADAGRLIREGLEDYVREVTQHEFPRNENTFGIEERELEAVQRALMAGTLTS